MPHRCVCGNCGNIKDDSRNISLHTIPFYGDEGAEEIRRRKRWVDFVKQRRARWEPSKTSKVCSGHFKDEDFMRQFSKGSRWLERDNIGICVFPTIHKVKVGTAALEKPPSNRERRMTIKVAMASHKAASDASGPSQQQCDEPPTKVANLTAASCSTTCTTDVDSPEEPCSLGQQQPDPVEIMENNEPLEEEMEEEKEEEENGNCNNCTVLENRNRILRNDIRSLQERLAKRRAEKRKYPSKIRKHVVQPTLNIAQGDQESLCQDSHSDGEEITGDEEEVEDEGVEEEEVEDENSSGSIYDTENETDTTETETDEDDADKSIR